MALEVYVKDRLGLCILNMYDHSCLSLAEKDEYEIVDDSFIVCDLDTFRQYVDTCIDLIFSKTYPLRYAATRHDYSSTTDFYYVNDKSVTIKSYCNKTSIDIIIYNYLLDIRYFIRDYDSEPKDARVLDFFERDELYHNLKCRINDLLIQ